MTQWVTYDFIICLRKKFASYFSHVRGKFVGNFIWWEKKVSKRKKGKERKKSCKYTQLRNNNKLFFISTPNGKPHPTPHYTPHAPNRHPYLNTLFIRTVSFSLHSYRPRVLRALVRDTPSPTQSASDAAADRGTSRTSAALLAATPTLASVSVNKYQHQ